MFTKLIFGLTSSTVSKTIELSIGVVLFGSAFACALAPANIMLSVFSKKILKSELFCERNILLTVDFLHEHFIRFLHQLLTHKVFRLKSIAFLIRTNSLAALSHRENLCLMTRLAWRNNFTEPSELL